MTIGQIDHGAAVRANGNAIGGGRFTAGGGQFELDPGVLVAAGRDDVFLDERLLAVYNSAGLLLYNNGRKRYEECASTTDLQPFTTRYLYLGRSLIASTEQGVCKTAVTRYHHTDALGSVVARTDPAKAITDRNRFEPYGKQTDLIPASVEPAFTGHNQDMSGLVYMQARYYDPAIGRFLATDPLGVANGNGGAFNRYAYADNNPMGRVDPDGRQDYAVLGNLCAYDGCIHGSKLEFNRESLTTAATVVGVGVLTAFGGVEVAAIASAVRLGYLVEGWYGAMTLGAARATPLAVAALESVAPGAGNGPSLAAVEQAAFKEAASKANFLRALGPEDLGIVGSVSELRGSFAMQDGVATMRVDMIDGTLKNPLQIVNNMVETARASGASTLRIEGSLANPRLYDVLKRRYGLESNGAVDSITLPIE